MASQINRPHPAGVSMAAVYRVALEGFSPFERTSLESFFRLANARTPSYTLAQSILDAQFIVADADDPDSVAAVIASERVAETVFVGTNIPGQAMARLPRPVDPIGIVRELDALAKLVEQAPTLRDAVVEPVAAQAASADEVAPAAPPSRGRPLRANIAAEVLVVEDSDVARRFLARSLEHIGLKPLLAATSGQALELLAGHRFAFVLIDIMLGDDSELDGLLLAQRIRQLHPKPRPERSKRDTGVPQIVFVTALAKQIDRVRGSLAGGDAYLTKPVDEAMLARTLADLSPALFAKPLARSRSAKPTPRDAG